MSIEISLFLFLICKKIPSFCPKSSGFGEKACPFLAEKGKSRLAKGTPLMRFCGGGMANLHPVSVFSGEMLGFAPR
jgi:hypothetical protein